MLIPRGFWVEFGWIVLQKKPTKVSDEAGKLIHCLSSLLEKLQQQQ